jgi:thiamine-phosphate pyrophosphorylase
MPSVDFRLLIVTDRHQTNGRPLRPLLERAVCAGAPAIQLRERDLCVRDLLALAREVHDMVRPRGSRLLINDRIDVALTLDGVGVHLRADSLPVSVARHLMGPDRLLGVSAHSPAEAAQAEREGADYVVLGPIYDTPSKRAFGPPLGLDRLEEACRASRIPIIGIGGITARRIPEVLRAGAFGVAVIAAVLSATDVEAATRELLQSLGCTSREVRASSRP